MGDKELIYCTKCGQQNHENNYKCTACDRLLHAPSATVAAVDETMGGLIPTGNPKALWAYYLGIFSFIPVIGIPLGIAAIVLGTGGVRHASRHPAAKGKVHAWVGIITGVFFLLMYTMLIIGMSSSG